MVDFKDHYRNTQSIYVDGKLLGYVHTAKGAHPGLIVNREDVADSQLGELFRALDDRDGAPCPDRTVSIVGIEVKAAEVTTYAQ